MGLPLVLIHGYSDSGDGFEKWHKELIEKRKPANSVIHVINYITLANEVTISDIAEGLERALHDQAGLTDGHQFDAIVHSTGMLVIRAWLARYSSPDRPKRLRHLIALAPATNGSPVAHKGRSWLGALVKGSKEWNGPDFLEAGNEVLHALELGSPFTWGLAEKDLFGDGNTARFKKGDHSPYVFTLCGDKNLGRVPSLAAQAIGTRINGSDGVVRWAGAALNSRRLLVDFTALAAQDGETNSAKLSISEWNNQNNILVLLPGLNHSTIMKPKRNSPLLSLVSEALDVDSNDAFEAWNQKAVQIAEVARGKRTAPNPWQQFVIRVLDERGDGVSDWTIILSSKKSGDTTEKVIKLEDLHPFERDRSYRCLHINLKDAGLDEPAAIQQTESLKLVLFLNTNSSYMVYGTSSADTTMLGGLRVTKGASEFEIDLSKWLKHNDDDFILPMAFTTTFIEIRVNREPLIRTDGKVEICHIQSPPGGVDR